MSTTAARPPAIPPRRTDTLGDEGVPDDPPVSFAFTSSFARPPLSVKLTLTRHRRPSLLAVQPAYEATPTAQAGEQSLEFGPSRPFQPPPGPPPRHPLTQSYTGASSSSSHSQNPHPAGPPPSNLPAPLFPFWNGANLTPQQTGFTPGTPTAPPNLPPRPGVGGPSSLGQPSQYSPPPHPPPGQSFSPPPGPPPSNGAQQSQQQQQQGYNPTTVPTPGQPLLRGGKILIYPVGHECRKCGNTGYKNNDPSHPCRNDWSKYGKPYTAAHRLAPNTSPSSNFQRPLRVFPPPQTQSPQSPPPQQFHPNPGYPSRITIMNAPPPPGPNVLVLRPGDPRMACI
ncbi:hypothetical protein MNV49_004003 [Pseudohyphozyma bogoriensis]|nr:hypothetical protein MNV49_004003 [Pseudohyphozyma bogoriensis]